MLQFIPVSDGNTIAIRASGKLDHKDYQNFLPRLEETISELKQSYDKVSVLFELDNFSGWNLNAFKDDFKFGLQHFHDFERLAIVGDKAWEHWMTLMAKPFLATAEIRYFNRENLQDAWDWLREKSDLELKAMQLAPYQQIVVAVDFSVYSKHAAKRAIELAHYYHASLTLLNVVEEFVPYSYYGDSMHTYVFDPEQVDKQNQQKLEHANRQLHELIEELDSAEILQAEVILGQTESTIVSYLEAQNVDLVVFGAKKKKGINKLIGSTPHYVQNHARCETLVVPLQESTF